MSHILVQRARSSKIDETSPDSSERRTPRSLVSPGPRPTCHTRQRASPAQPRESMVWGLHAGAILPRRAHMRRSRRARTIMPRARSCIIALSQHAAADMLSGPSGRLLERRPSELRRSHLHLSRLRRAPHALERGSAHGVRPTRCDWAHALRPTLVPPAPQCTHHQRGRTQICPAARRHTRREHRATSTTLSRRGSF